MKVLTKFTENRRNIIWMGLVFILILGIFLHRFSTWKWGVGVSHDSIFYISAAENFLEGNGISRIGGGNVVKPLTHFPPLYPISLSILGYFIDVREAADWSTAFLFGINAVLVTLVIFQGSGSLSGGLLGGLLVLVSPILLSIHLEAMSEPLYIASTLTSLILLAIYLRDRKNWQLIAAAITASAAYLTRYIGVSVLLTGLLSIFLLYPGAFRTRIKKVVLYGSIAIIPNLIWYVRNYLLTGSLTNRVLTFHPVTQDKLKEGFLSISEWIFPESTHIGLALGIIVFVAFMVIIGFILQFVNAKKASINRKVVWNHTIPTVIVIHSIIYVALLFTSLTFFDISTRLNIRILLPLYVMLLILSVISFQWIFVTSRISLQKFITLVGTVLFTLVVIVYVSRSWELIKVMRQEGSGYNSASWRNSEIVAMLKGLVPGAIVYSNEAFPLYYLTGIGAFGIPEKFDPVKSVVRDDFQSSMEIMRERLKAPKSALVVFHQGYLREGMPSLDEITAGFVIAHESRDGVILVDPDHLNDWQNQQE